MSSHRKIRLDIAAEKQAMNKQRLDMDNEKAHFDHHAELEDRFHTLKAKRRELKKQLKTALNALPQDSDSASDIASDLKRIDAQIFITETAANRALATLEAFLEEKQTATQKPKNRL